MVTEILIINKRNPRQMYIVQTEDWLNPRMYIIDAQIPYIGETTIIQKSQYKIRGFLDENGDERLFGRVVKNVWD